MANFVRFSPNFFYAAVLFSAAVFSSCNIINPSEPVPAYLKISPFNFVITDISQGTASNKIEDVWVYVDDELQGTYELPANFPVIGTGSHSIKLRPGIYLNGIKSYRFPYAFYSIYDTVINLEPGKEYAIDPVTSYTAGLQFTTESFDNSGGIIFDTTSNSDTQMLITTNAAEVFEGAGSGKAFVDSSASRLEIATGNLTLPIFGQEKTFVEFHYKTSIPLLVGVIANGYTPDHIPIISLKPNSEWNKIYLEITNIVHATPEATSFRIYFNAAVYELNETGTVYLDNFKVIHN
jgi:hypothetical protein